MKDLVLLVPDKNTQFALQGGLGRPQALEIQPLEFEIRVHPGRDGGVRTSGAQVLALERTRFRHALMLMDIEGSGADTGASELEARLDSALGLRWGKDAKAIVIDPEVDVWMWGSDNLIQQVIGWVEEVGIRSWLVDQGFDFLRNEKPVRPKEALERLLREVSLARSSALYQQIASRISLRNCTDAAFQRMAGQLRLWFPPK